MLKIIIKANVYLIDFLLKYNDITPLAKAYVAELAEFIDIAQNDTKRILGKHNLF